MLTNYVPILLTMILTLYINWYNTYMYLNCNEDNNIWTKWTIFYSIYYCLSIIYHQSWWKYLFTNRKVNNYNLQSY